MLRSLMDNLRKRVFVLGPSHHFHLNSFALYKCKTHATPVGDLPLDLESGSLLSLPFAMRLIVTCSHRRIARNGNSSESEMDIQTDEDEHSIEIHLPYVRKAFKG